MPDYQLDIRSNDASSQFMVHIK